jgi:hypothetical protein
MFIQPKTGLLPMYIPPEEAIYVNDVHRGPVGIWKHMKGTLFCDIDGTVADLAHRRVFVATKPKNWPAFEKTIHLDKPIQPIIDAVAELFSHGWTVVMCTGRGAQNRPITEGWLAHYGVPYHAMYTRAIKDYRADNIVKAELLMQARADGYDPDVVFDDRNQVVEMWRAHGIPCVQVAEGDF